MKKWICMVVVGMLMFSMAGCSKKLSKEFDEEAVLEEAKVIIDMVNEGETEAIWDEKFNAKMQNALPKEEWLQAIDPVMEEAGAFQEYEKEAVTGTEEPDTGEEFATAVIVAKYENGKNQYTISFNTAMQMTGFFIK